MDEMQILTTRVDRLENKIAEDIERIFAKLEALAISAAARRDCPQPGLCIYLQTEIKKQDDRISAQDAKMEIHNQRLTNIERWQAWIMGGLGLLLIVLTLFGPAIRGMFHLPN